MSRERFHAAYAVLEDAIQQRAFPGCSFGLYAEGRVLLLDALGHQTYGEASPAITLATRYDIASVSKVVATAAAAMLLHQRGQLQLDTPLGELLPGFLIGRPDAALARQVTLRHLLAHSSGLPGYEPLYELCRTSYELLRATLTLPIEAVPGTRAEYSDHGFILLGKAIEVITQQPLGLFVQNEILIPLGLTHTGYNPAREERPQIPPTEDDRTPFRHSIIQGEVQDEHCWLLGGIAGHAGLFSNVPDLLAFAQEVLQTKMLFTETTIDEFAQRQAPAGSSRALGWDTPSEPSSSGQFFSKNSLGHLGYAGTSLWLDRDRQLAAVLLTNRTWPDRGSQLIKQVRPAFHDALASAL